MENKDLEKSTNLEDNLPMVTYIMLHRVYDMLTLIAQSMCEEEKVLKMVQYHEQGYLLGPSPSYKPGEENAQE